MIQLTTDMAFLGTALSANMMETDDGFLICRNVPVSRTGVQMYLAQELGLPLGTGQPVKVYRLPDDVFALEAMRSAESKPTTNNHPPAGVDIYNAGTYVVGHARNARRDGDNLILDLIFTDAHTIETIKSGHKREVSAGYTCEYEPYEDGYKQTNIRINHIAVVTKGRAGPTVAIKDEETVKSNNRKRSVKPMKKEQINAIILRAVAKDSEPEELEAVLAHLTKDSAVATPAPAPEKTNDDMFTKLAALISGKKQTADADGDEDETKMEKLEKKVDDMAAMMTTFIEKFTADEDGDEDKPKETEDDDPDMTFAEVVADEDEDAEAEAKAKEATDAAYKKLISDLKPHIAKLPAKAQKQVADALKLAKVANGKNAYAGIKAAQTSHARKTTDADKIRNLGKEWAERFNPHYKKAN